MLEQVLHVPRDRQLIATAETHAATAASRIVKPLLRVEETMTDGILGGVRIQHHADEFLHLIGDDALMVDRLLKLGSALELKQRGFATDN